MEYDVYVMKVLTAANQIGNILLMSGAETYRVEYAISQICRRFGLKSESFVTMTCVLTSAKKKNGEIITEVNRIYTVSNNLDKIDRIHKILLNIKDYELEDLEKEIKFIQTKSLYSKRILLISYFFVAGFFSVLFNGKFKDFIVAGLGGIVVFYMGNFANKLKVNNFFINTLGGFVITLISIFFTKIHFTSSPSYSAIGTLMILVPGLALTNAIRDLINGDLIAGTSRTVEAFLVGSALAIGTGFALFAASYLF